MVFVPVHQFRFIFPIQHLGNELGNGSDTLKWSYFQPLPSLYLLHIRRRFLSSLSFATVEVEEISGSQPAEVHNFGRYLKPSAGSMFIPLRCGRQDDFSFYLLKYLCNLKFPLKLHYEYREVSWHLLDMSLCLAWFNHSFEAILFRFVIYLIFSAG